MSSTGDSGQLSMWANYDSTVPIKYVVHADSVALSFGQGELELAFTESALETLLSVGRKALQEMREPAAS
ncbi:hypothetical protein ACQPZF_29075 [Actinosynnema sp. CS-041913]|uniref:hypothetical protein n=1 Tax=Actinosynnema sp. CS-041913 TaxID=3239917 RepID=UPI003D947FE3